MTDSTDSHTNRETAIPPAVGEQLRTVQRLEDRPRSIAEWGRAIGDLVGREDIDVGLAALCTTDESPHRARFDGTTRHFVCVQDAFIVPAVVEDVDTVTITTESPKSGERIEVVVTDGEVETDPAGAVMSVGVAADVPDPAADADSPAIAYGQICPYGHAFLDREEYEAWADTVEAHTMVAPLDAALELARAIDDATD